VAAVGAAIEQYTIRAPIRGVETSAVSGGNQQKLVGTEFSSSPLLVIAAHPTRDSISGPSISAA